MFESKNTRRRFIQGGLAASTGLALASASKPIHAQPLRKIKLTLSWIPDATSLPCHVAQAKGFWAKRGLDVDVVRGTGSSAAVQAMVNGQFDFCYASAPAGVVASTKGMKITHIAVTSYNSTMSLAVLADSPIKTPKDLEGRSLGCVIDSGDYPFLPVFAAKAGIDLKKVSIVQTDLKIRNQLLVQKKIDAMTGYTQTSAPLLISQGVGMRYFQYANYGLALYGNSLMTRTELYKKEPALCQAVVDGLLEGFKYMMLNPQESLDLLMKEVPESALVPTARAQYQLGYGVNVVTMLQGPVREQGLGYGDPAAYEQMIDLTMKYVAKPDDVRPTAAEMLTNEFVGKLHLADEEWKRVDESVASFKQYIL
jgi:NitT/TauT family transport system substrate-binding protein